MNFEAVADAGPLIHLHQIGALLCLEIFETIHVGDVVWREATQVNRIPENQLLNLHAVQRHSVATSAIASYVQLHSFHHLHSGEQEALQLCDNLKIPLLLTDDLAVRESAATVDVTPAGSVGIIARAYHQQIVSLDEAVNLLRKLQHESSLFVTSSIIEMAIEQIQQN